MLQPLRRRHALLAALVVAGGLVLASAANAQAQDDPPDRAARLNYISGQVSFRPASLDEWGVASLNYPLTAGDHLWTDRNAQAELHIGSAAIRLAPETAFSFLNLDDDMVQARVAEGSIDVRVRDVTARDAYEVDTPHAAISLVQPGTYRVDVDPDRDRTRVIVRSGQVDVNGSGGWFSLYAGDMAEISGTNEMTYEIDRAPAPDGWEQWCRSRDEREDNRLAMRYVSREMTGYEDLDDYGSWDYVPEYGWAWQPTVVAVDWAPYRYGRWCWRGHWGWTWIDSAPWGFAPFHYGRWANYHDHWIWVPGRMVARPVWAPALVAFMGGPSWSISFGFGVRPAVAWFPLAPGEPYCPPYHASALYVRNVNMTHVNGRFANADVGAMRYRNRTVTGAVTAVPRDVFVGAQPVRRTALAMPRSAVEQVPVVGHGAAMSPEPGSIMGHIAAAVPRPRPSVAERPVVARAQPPADVVRADPVVTLGSRVPRAARPAPTESAAGGVDNSNRRVAPSGGRPRAAEDRPASAGGADTPDGRQRLDSQPSADGRHTDTGNYLGVGRRPQPAGSAAGAAGDKPRVQPAPRPEVLVHDGTTPGWRSSETPRPSPPPASLYDRSSGSERGGASARATTNDRPPEAGRTPAGRGYEQGSGTQRSVPRYERPMVDDRGAAESAPAGHASEGARQETAGRRGAAESERPTQARPGGNERGADRTAPSAQSDRTSAQPARGAGAPSRGSERSQPQQSGGRGGQTGGQSQSKGGATPRGGRG